MSGPPVEHAALALRARVLTPLAAGGVRYLDDALVEVGGDGRLVGVTPWRGPPVRPVLDLRGRLLVPGFVDAHVHYPQTRIIGRATGPLLRWLERSVFPEEARFLKPSYARVVADEFVDRLLAAGTTTAAVFSSSSARATGVLFARLAARGLRAVVGLTLMDRQAPDALLVPRKQAMEASRELIQRWHGHDRGRLQFAVTPRFAPSCSRGLLRDAGALAAEHGLLVQTHIAETRAEKRAALAAHRYARDYLDVYERAGLVGERTVLAHAIHLTQPEWRRVAHKGATIAHCPDSNFFLGSGRMPLAAVLARGVVVGLGSDVGAGRSFSLQSAMASAYDTALSLEKPVDAEALFRLSTLGGATALGLGDRIGSLEPGKDADMVVMTAAEWLRRRDDVLSALVFDRDLCRVEACYVRGKLVSSEA
jgi:guanine deaminase